MYFKIFYCIFYMLQKSNPGRFKELHYYRAGVLIDSILPFMKLFMPKKLTDRVRLTIYNRIPIFSTQSDF